MVAKVELQVLDVEEARGAGRRSRPAPRGCAGYLKSATLSLVTIAVPVSTFASTVSPMTAL